MSRRTWWVRAISLADGHGHGHRLRALRSAALSPNEHRNRLDDAALSLLLASTLSANSNCIDVGAHRGTVLDEMARVSPRGRHIALEPHPDLAEHLRQRFPAVDVHQCAASDREAEAEMYTWPAAPAYSSLAWVPARAETQHVYPAAEDHIRLTVPTVTLDELVGDRVISFVKIDVEGAEAHALAGAKGILGRDRPVVAFEHSLACLRHGAVAGDSVFDILHPVGLRIFDMEGGGPYTRDDFRAEVESGRRWFYFARP